MHERWAGFLPDEQPAGGRSADQGSAEHAARVWDEVPFEDDPRGLTGPYRVAAAVGGTLVVLALVAAWLAGGHGRADVEATVPAPVPAEPLAGSLPTEPAAPPAALGAPPAAVAAPLAALALAALEVRRQLSDPPWGDRAPGGQQGGAQRQYVDAAEPEAAVTVGDVTIVSVAAVILRTQGDTWATASQERFAIALQRADGGLAALGPPWPLAARGSGQPPAFTAARDADAEAAVAEVLATAGWTDVADVQAGSAPAGWHRVRVRARPPAGTQVSQHEVWLRDDRGAPVLVDPAADAAIAD